MNGSPSCRSSFLNRCVSWWKSALELTRGSRKSFQLSLRRLFWSTLQWTLAYSGVQAPRKWWGRWLTISRLRDLIKAQWCEDTKSIILDSDHYHGHVTVAHDHPHFFHFIFYHLQLTHCLSLLGSHQGCRVFKHTHRPLHKNTNHLFVWPSHM
jgi:hypothetical protein